MPQARNRIDYAVLLGAVMALVLITPNNVLANRAVPPGMVFIPGGEFEMGCHAETGEECIGDELPVHSVSVSSFYMDVHEMTNEQYCAYLNSAHSQGAIDVIDGVVYQAGGGEPYCSTYSARDDSHMHWDGSSFAVTSGKHNHPMMLVSWYGAVAYANWCSAQQGRTPCYSLSSWICDFDANGYRLPTEAEWEYASRGGNRDPYYAYPWGNTIDGSNANYHLSGDPYETGPIPCTTPAGYYAPNGYGLYDVSGNVFEWCNDWRAWGYYGFSPYSDPQGPSGGTHRVLRGGSWANYPTDLRCADRNGQPPDMIHFNNVGFRLALQSNGGLEEGLVGHWRFDEGTGGTVYDSTGSGYEGAIHGPTWVSGIVGSALSFDGINDYVEIDADLSLHHHPGQISVAGWVQVLSVDTDQSSQSRQPILAKGLPGEWEYALYVHDNMDAGLSVWQGSGAPHNEIRGGDLFFANWHHVVGTYCHGITRVYVDGSCVAIGTDPSGEVFDGTRPIRIGSREDNQFLNAIIDEIRVYAKALSDEEVERLYGGRPLAIGVHQRADASKLVDVVYSLSGFSDQSYSVTVQVSDDAGDTWTIEPTAVWGDVGEGVVPGDDKHIIWNPSVDLPGVGGSNFKVRLTSDVPYFGDSNVFSITPAGPGDLIGTVRDQATGDPVVGANVGVNGEPPVQTDEYGQFFLSDVPAGQAALDVTATGYYPLSQIVQIREESFTDVNILLTPDTGFGVVSVRGQYCGPGTHAYYLNGVNLTEAFTATIDWGGHGAGELHWITPQETLIDDCSGGQTTVSRNFNMGSAFGVGGTLKVMAVGADLAESLPYTVNFATIGPPLMIPLDAVRPAQSGATLTYGVDGDACPIEPIDEGAGAGDIPADIPFFSLDNVTLKTKGMFSGSIRGDGTVEGTLSTPDWAIPETMIGGLSFQPEISGTWAFHFNSDTDVWEQTEAALEIVIDATAETPPYPLWPLPLIYAYGEAGITFGMGLTAINSTAPLQTDYEFTGQVKPWIGGGVGAGLTDIACVEGYVNGGLHFLFVCPPEDSPCWGCLDRFGLWVKAGARAKVMFVEIFHISATWTHDFCGGRWDSQYWADERYTARILDRDYLRRGEYAVFVANLYDTRGARDEVTIEIPLQVNVFPWSEPDLAASGDDLLLAWVYDDPNRTPVNRTEVIFSKYDSGSELWTEPEPVADDGTADFHPRITALPNGDALLAWENVKEVLIEPDEPGDPCIDECMGDPNYTDCLVECKLEEAKAKLEIAVARYDAVLGEWGPAVTLTDNVYLDRSPRVVAAADGTAMLTWVSNAANDEVGSNGMPNDIHYSVFDGASWSATADVALGVPSIVKSTLAYNSTEALVLFIGDLDDDQDTLEDRELYAVEYAEGAWGAVQRLTDDAVEDTNPQVAYDATGTPLLVWWSGGEIEMATDLSLADRHTIVASVDGVTPGKSYLRLARGLDGQLGLVWETASDALIDMWTALYDPVLQSWTKRMLLTSDDSEERSMSCVFDETGDLVVAYNKVETVYETEIITVGDVEVEAQIADSGEASLYLLRHIVGGDLATSDDDVTLDPPNPVAGQTATITAVVKNLGDVAAADVDVAFYDGDPGGAGVLIEVTTHGGPLVGSDEAEVSADWLVPELNRFPRHLRGGGSGL